MIVKKNLKNNQNFKNIQKIILKKLNIKKFEHLKNILKNEKTKDLREDDNLMIKIEQNLLCILKEANIKNFKSLQYPVNIRIVNNFSNPHYTDYDTRLIHCDAWSGAPKDSINGFIYIFVENNCPKIEIYNPLNKEDELRDYLGSYKKVNINKRKLKKINFLTEVGNFIMWETYTPHRSILDEKKKERKILELA